ncbi:MAG: family 20 glycosylhydrolase [Bacteroidaceae bacterium]|nr:family 20 glycosylhydrolase [Bacteroidaceae bacterium]
MTKKIILALVALVLCLPTAVQAKVEHLLPKPQEVTVTPGVAFALSGAVSINYADGVAACELLEEVFTENGCTIATGGKAVNVSYVQSIDGAHDYALHGYDNEAYTLEITANEINITAVTATGVIRAAQTLAQLAEGYEGAKALEGLTMKDWPAFKLRGYMHDVGRSFISIDELIKQVELFSRFKINTFHWHMTENQAWRFEVKAYPQLTSSASMTRFPGQYYTQDDCKRLLAVAKKHGVIVIPEIDMPGHSEAFERAMGFGMQTEDGKAVLKKVIDEVVAVFEGVPYLHIGGDEVSTTAAYLNEMIAYAESKGTNVKGGLWNPINGIGQDALHHTLAQMWGTRGYLATGKANIDCRYNYTNHFDVFADLVGIYKSNIYYHAQGTPEVAGAISGCWNDRKVATEVDIMAQNNVWANVIATAERAWMGGGKRYIDNMTNTPNNLKVDGGHGGVMLPNSGEEYEEFKSWETRFLFHKANSLKGEPIPYVKQTNVRWRITDAFPNGGSETAAFGPETAGTTAATDLLPEVYTHKGKTYYTGMATGAGIYLAHTWGNSIIDAYYKNPQYNHTAYAWTYVYSPEAQTVGAQIEFQNYSRSEQDGAAPAGKWDHFGSKIWVNGEEIAAPTWDNTGVSVNNKEVMLKNENFPGRKPIQVTLKQGWNKVFLKLPYFNKGYRLKKWMFTCVFTDLEGVNAVDGLIYSPNQCMDETTEAVAAKISEIKRDRGAYVGTSVGLWSETAAAELDAKVAEIEATYSATMTAEERAAQLAALTAAWAAFQANLTAEHMNQPVSGSYYRMYTPQRDNRYPTGKGAGQAIIGEQNPSTNASIWQFVTRADGSYNIINLADGTYISPASNNNTALNCVTAEPTKGWTLKPAATIGQVIVTCGNVQFNQTNGGQSFKLYNWGDGTNTTDGGCQYAFIEIIPDLAPNAFAFVGGTEFQAYPYAAPANVASQVFSKENITIAIDVTMPASLSNNTRYALVCGADPTKGVTGATKTNSPYVGFGLNGSNPVYLPSSASGDKFTYRDHSFAGNTNYKVVYVIDKAAQTFKIYVNGALKSTATYPIQGYELQSFSNFASNANTKLYIGGGVVNNTTAHDKFGGKIHSVHFFEGALSAEEISMIDYAKVPENSVVSSPEEFIKGGIYTFVTTRGWMGATADNSNVISTAKTNVTPAADNANFQWTVYKSFNGNYYLYNIGKQQFMGVQSTNNASVPFVSTPAGKTLTFKQSGSEEYPIMFSTDNAGVVNHSANHGSGLITWTGGWSNPNDAGSNHKVTLVGILPAEELQKIADLVEAYDKGLPVTTVIEGLEENNPNIYLGSVRATNATGALTTKLQKGEGTTFFSFDGTQTTTIDFTRAYRGFEFQGYFVGEESLGTSFELTQELQERITEENPLVAKFTTTEDVTLFSDNDPFSYRIPAIGKTSTGRLIAVSDYRYSLDDIGRYNYGTANPGIDLVIRTSDDNGKTWSDKQTIAAGSRVRGTDDCAYGDAAIAVVGEKILVMAAAGDVMFGNGSATAHNRAVRVFSEDNGVTWTKQDISETLFLGDDATIKNGYTAFFGSGRLAVDENYNGTGKPRIYGALLLKKASGTGNYVIYTDDLGLTWNILGGSQDPVASQDEPKVEILPRGQILLSIRRGGGRQFNVFTYTNKDTNKGTWDNNVNGCGNGGSNTCNGEPYLVDAVNADGKAVKLLLQSQPKGGSGLYDRRDVTIWYKEVKAATNYTAASIAENWTEGLQVSTQQSAYSAMTLQDDGKIAFFFEEAPCFGDDQAKGYCMVYTPLTIEAITKGKYSTPEGDATGIIGAPTLNANTNIYDLSGRCVEKASKGVYIVNGKKVVY